MKRKRCANGTRRNKTTGVCESTSAARARRANRSQLRKAVGEREAVFYDIADDIMMMSPPSGKKRKTSSSSSSSLATRIRTYLQKHPTIKYGDILFVGKYTYLLVLEGGLILTDKDPTQLPLSPRVLPELKRRRVHYGTLLQQLVSEGKYGADNTTIQSVYRENGIL